MNNSLQDYDPYGFTGIFAAVMLPAVLPPTLGRNLKYLRGKADTTQAELATAIEASQSDVSKWELDKATPPVPTLIRIAKILGCSVEDLLRGVDPAYDEIVIRQRDLSGHSGKGESVLYRGGPGAPTSSRVQQLEQELRERDRLISQAEAAARKTLLVFQATKENRGPGAQQSQRRGARRKTG